MLGKTYTITITRVSTFSSDIAELVSGEWQHITGVAPRQLLKKRFSYGTAIKMLQRFSRKRLDRSHKTSRNRIAASGHSLHEHAERLERKRSRYFLLRPEMLTGSRALLCSSAAMWTWIDLSGVSVVASPPSASGTLRT